MAQQPQHDQVRVKPIQAILMPDIRIIIRLCPQQPNVLHDLVLALPQKHNSTSRQLESCVTFLLKNTASVWIAEPSLDSVSSNDDRSDGGLTYSIGVIWCRSLSHR